MNIRIRADSVEVEGYVNAIERNSKPLRSRIGRFIERIAKGAFKRAIEKNGNIEVMLNHLKPLGSTADGSLQLYEDNIGLHARAVITDHEVIESARSGDLVGWSFGFNDSPGGVENVTDQETGLPLRIVRDMELAEVSILDRSRVPAYDGTLINVRSDEEYTLYSAEFLDGAEIIDESKQHETSESENRDIDYSEYESLIDEMKGTK